MSSVNSNNNSLNNNGQTLNSLSRFFNGTIPRGIALLFNFADTNKDGHVSETEFNAFDTKVKVFLQNDKNIRADELASIFKTQEDKEKAVKSYWSLFFGNEKKSNSQCNSYLKALAKNNSEKTKELDTKGISQTVYNLFTEFCKSGWGAGESKDGINAKVDLYDEKERSFYQGKTNNCYFLSFVLSECLANDGDLSDILRSDGKGGAIITLQGMLDSEGKHVEINISEEEINYIRRMQRNNQVHKSDFEGIGARYISYEYDIADKKPTKLSKGDTDVLALELASIKYHFYRNIIDFIRTPQKDFNDKIPKKHFEKTLKEIYDALSKSPVGNELKKHIIEQKKINHYIEESDVYISRAKNFKLDDATISRIMNNKYAKEAFYSHYKTYYNMAVETAAKSKGRIKADKEFIRLVKGVAANYDNSDKLYNYRTIINALNINDGDFCATDDEIRNFKLTPENLTAIYNTDGKKDDEKTLYLSKEVKGFVIDYLLKVDLDLTHKNDIEPEKTNFDVLYPIIDYGGYSEDLIVDWKGHNAYICTQNKNRVYTRSISPSDNFGERKYLTPKNNEEYLENNDILINELDKAVTKYKKIILVIKNINHAVALKSYTPGNNTIEIYDPNDPEQSRFIEKKDICEFIVEEEQ